MSFLPADITVISAAALGLLSPVLFMRRDVGGFIADVTLEEDHNDEIEISDHPVERGSEVTDNAFKRPPSVTITAGWSNSSLRALGNPFYVQLVYNQFLALQASLQPFSISTGKRVYDNMLIKRLATKTDEKTENALFLVIECRNVQLVSTQTVSSGSGEKKNMKDAVNNSGVTNRGTITVRSVNNPDAFSTGPA